MNLLITFFFMEKRQYFRMDYQTVYEIFAMRRE